MIKIKSCLFCGYDDTEVVITFGDSYYVYCDNCGARGAKGLSEEFAVDSWNEPQNIDRLSVFKNEERAVLNHLTNGLAVPPASAGSTQMPSDNLTVDSSALRQA